MAETVDWVEFVKAQCDDLKRQYADAGYTPVTDEVASYEMMLPCRDGIKLRTLIYLPVNHQSSFPVIAQRSCYAENEPKFEIHGEELAKRGFAFVSQFCRGIGGSEGKWEPNVNERKDGKDFIDWLQAQRWARVIGYYGGSYQALTGWSIADIVPDKVKSMYLEVYGVYRFDSSYESGMFRPDVDTAWAMSNAGTPIDADYLTSCAYMPQIHVDTDLWHCDLPWYREWVSHPSENDPYWSNGIWGELKKIPARTHCSLYLTDGWYDHHLSSTLKTYESLPEETKKKSILRIGPWNHFCKSAIGDLYPDNVPDRDAPRDILWWFTNTLKEDNAAKISGVWTYTIGEQKWQKQLSYPIPVKNNMVLYLSENGLDENEPDTIKSLSYVYDPSNPIKTHGAESLFRTRNEVGVKRQPQTGYRDDVLSFVSKPLTEDFEIDGEITADLFVSSEAEDTCFTVKLMEVLPNGESYNIRNGIGTLQYRNGKDPEPYQPNKIVKLSITTWDITWKIREGSCIRLDISSSDFPEYAIHSNNAGLWSVQTRNKQAEQTIYFSEEYPSSILLRTKY